MIKKCRSCVFVSWRRLPLNVARKIVAKFVGTRRATLVLQFAAVAPKRDHRLRETAIPRFCDEAASCRLWDDESAQGRQVELVCCRWKKRCF